MERKVNRKYLSSRKKKKFVEQARRARREKRIYEWTHPKKISFEEMTPKQQRKAKQYSESVKLMFSDMFIQKGDQAGSDPTPQSHPNRPA